MTNILSALQCVIRIIFAGTLGYTVVSEILRTDPSLAGWHLSPRGFGLASSFICVLLAGVSVWLLVGGRTRVLALLGALLYLGLVVVKPGFNSSDSATIATSAYVVLLALPLVLFGGGQFSILRSGWSNPA